MQRARAPSTKYRSCNYSFPCAPLLSQGSSVPPKSHQCPWEPRQEQELQLPQHCQVVLQVNSPTKASKAFPLKQEPPVQGDEAGDRAAGPKPHHTLLAGSRGKRGWVPSAHGTNCWLCRMAFPNRARSVVQGLQHLQAPPAWVASRTILSWQSVKALAGRGGKADGAAH